MGHKAKQLADEISFLREQQVESLKRHTFAPSDEELKMQDELLNRIREVGADYLIAVKEGAPLAPSIDTAKDDG
jgi:hypothetical protein